MSDAVVIAERLPGPAHESVLTPAAVVFLAELVRRFHDAALRVRAVAIDGPGTPSTGVTALRPPRPRIEGWRCVPPPPELAGPRVDLVGSVDTATVLSAVSSRPTAFVADLDDATAPHWRDVLASQSLLRGVIARARRLGPSAGPPLPPILLRPRALTRDEEHIFVDGRAVPAALFDFGLYCFHDAHALLAYGTRPYLSLTKLHGVAEARLWEAICTWTEDALGLAHCSIGVGLRIDTVSALDELDDMLWELRYRSIGLSCSRADYVRDLIASNADAREERRVTPPRSFLTVDRPPLASVAARVIRICRARGVQALGPLVNTASPGVREGAVRSVYAQVYSAAARHSRVGFDGTSVADASYVAVARAALAATAAECRPAAPAPHTRAAFDRATAPAPDEASVRENVRVALVHLEAALEGRARVRREWFVEDRATARAARAQLWEWIRRRIALDDGRVLERSSFLAIARDEATRLRVPSHARCALERVCLAEDHSALEEREEMLDRDLVMSG